MKDELGVSIPKDFSKAVRDIKLAILQTRAKAAHLANAEALKLYFFVGGYVSKKTRNAKWGSGAIEALSERLQVELPGPRGFSASSIKRMRAFFEAWSDVLSIRPMPLDETGLTPIRPTSLGEYGEDAFMLFLSLGFSFHATILEKTQNVDERFYYVMRAAKEMWSHACLLEHLRADDYHHVGALPNNFEKTLSPMVLATQAVRSFKDEYLLDLINLDNVDVRYGYEIDERVLSKSMVASIEKTIAALGGNDFCFMGREKRLVVSDEEFFVDLLFFHRGLKAMVAIELKMGDFHPGYLGQLNFYLAAIDKLMKKPDENPTIGLLLCEKVNKPVVQLAVQGYSQPIGIATYRALRNIPEPYKMLAPVIDGVRKVMVESAKAKSDKRKGSKK